MTTATNIRFGDLRTGDRILGNLLVDGTYSVFRVVGGSRWGTGRLRVTFEDLSNGEFHDEIDVVDSLRATAW